MAFFLQNQATWRLNGPTCPTMEFFPVLMWCTKSFRTNFAHCIYAPRKVTRMDGCVNLPLGNKSRTMKNDNNGDHLHLKSIFPFNKPLVVPVERTIIISFPNPLAPFSFSQQHGKKKKTRPGVLRGSLHSTTKLKNSLPLTSK